MAEAPRSVAVVGGGIAGLWAARQLATRGIEVSILEADHVGAGASAASAGWVSPVQAGPLPRPGQVRHGLRSLLSSRGALSIKPGVALTMIPWLAAFARYCNEADFQRGVAILAELGYGSIGLLEDLQERRPKMRFARTGLLVAARTPDAVEQHLADLAPLRRFGASLPAELLTPDQMRAAEPSLHGDFVGAWFEDHWQLDPELLLTELAEEVREQGVVIHEHAAVVGFEVRSRKAIAALTAADAFHADAFVIACGATSSELCRRMGISLPVVPGRGYSSDTRPGRMPKTPILLADAHVALAPIGDRLRVAGVMEFSGARARIDRRRLQAMLGFAESALGPLGPADAARSGLRPIAPDGLPVAGVLQPFDNMYAAGAFAMHGLTLAPGVAELLAEEIATGTRHTLSALLALARFH